ncbi:transposase [Streptomyces formicae]|nr:transposase [Streptomyces formicae]
MTPPTSRTWSRRGHTPVVRVRGDSQRRLSVAALSCYKPGERTRLVFRPKQNVDDKRGGRRSFTFAGYRDLLAAAHQQLGAPLVLFWDNLNVHLNARLRAFIDTRDWIISFQLPSYAPDLNPVEGVWSLVRRSAQCNTAFTDPDHLIRTLRRSLREIQYRPELIDACLTITTSRPQPQ